MTPLYCFGSINSQKPHTGQKHANNWHSFIARRSFPASHCFSFVYTGDTNSIHHFAMTFRPPLKSCIRWLLYPYFVTRCGDKPTNCLRALMTSTTPLPPPLLIFWWDSLDLLCRSFLYKINSSPDLLFHSMSTSIVEQSYSIWPRSDFP